MAHFPLARRDYAEASLPKTGISQNGWPASENPNDIGITTVTLNLRNGTKTVQVANKAAEPLREIIKWWDENIEPVETVYGYNYREIRGEEKTGKLSNHASGTAVDINASKHALGVEGTVPFTTRASITAKAALLGLRWGGDYRHRKDEMHFEVMFSPGTEIVRRKVMKYWWLGVIGITAVVGAAVYRKRFL